MACVSEISRQRPPVAVRPSPTPAADVSAGVEQLAPGALQRAPSPKPLAERRAVSLGHLSTSGMRVVGETEGEEGSLVSLPSSACAPTTPELLLLPDRVIPTLALVASAPPLGALQEERKDPPRSLSESDQCVRQLNRQLAMFYNSAEPENSALWKKQTSSFLQDLGRVVDILTMTLKTNPGEAVRLSSDEEFVQFLQLAPSIERSHALCHSWKGLFISNEVRSIFDKLREMVLITCLVRHSMVEYYSERIGHEFFIMYDEKYWESGRISFSWMDVLQASLQEKIQRTPALVATLTHFAKADFNQKDARIIIKNLISKSDGFLQYAVGLRKEFAEERSRIIKGQSSISAHVLQQELTRHSLVMEAYKPFYAKIRQSMGDFYQSNDEQRWHQLSQDLS